jgi:hypothetical protein
MLGKIVDGVMEAGVLGLQGHSFGAVLGGGLVTGAATCTEPFDFGVKEGMVRHHTLGGDVRKDGLPDGQFLFGGGEAFAKGVVGYFGHGFSCVGKGLLGALPDFMGWYGIGCVCVDYHDVSISRMFFAGETVISLIE